MTLDAFFGTLAAWVRSALGAVKTHPLAAFLVTAFAFSWSDWLSLAWTGGRVVPGRLPTDMAGMFGPAFAALAVAAIGGGEAGIRELGRRVLRLPLRDPWFWLLAPSPLWLALAWLAARAALGASTPALARLASYPGLPSMPVYTVFDFLLLGVGFGQEIGWRGFALPRLQARAGPLGGTLLVAVAWGAWLAPLAALHGPRAGAGHLPATELALAAALVVACSVVLAFVVARTGGSIPAAALWHASLRLVTGTEGAREGMGEAVAAAVFAAAATLVVAELAARRSGRSILAELPDGA